MPLDHYVSQVHLKNFNSRPPDKEMLYAVKKSDLKSFRCHSDNVCRIENGSTNAYLRNDRLIEEFLRTIEPKYNASVAKLRDNNIDQECIYVIAGFVAYVLCCAPTGMRIQTTPIQGMLEDGATILEKHKALPEVPDEVGSKSVTELLAEKAIFFNVDPKYPQAIGIASIIQFVSDFGNSKWEILQNDISDSPFFTSDFPVAIEETDPQGPLNRIVPLTSDLAIRIIPDIQLFNKEPDLSFSKFRYRYPRVARAEVVEINRLIVRCAEDMIFYRDNHKWISNFVAKNRHYRIETIIKRVSEANGILSISRSQIVPYRYDA